MERLQIPYAVIGQAAYEIRNGLPLSQPKIIFGVLPQYNIPEITRMITSVIPNIELQTDGYRVHRNGVNLIIRMLTRKYPTLIDPDTVYYANWDYPLPNPFDVYWKLEDHYDR